MEILRMKMGKIFKRLINQRDVSRISDMYFEIIDYTKQTWPDMPSITLMIIIKIIIDFITVDFLDVANQACYQMENILKDMTNEDPSLLESNVEDFYLLFAYFLFKEGEI